jgi:uncharacterized damage-inducible protein DinB
MQRTDVDLCLDHLYLVRDRIIAATREAPEAMTETDHPTVRSLHATLVHELDVEWSWRVRLDSDHPTDFGEFEAELTTEDLPTIDAIEARWREDEVAMRAWIERLGDEGLAAPCQAERPSRHPLWVHVMHVYAHGIQQFSDAATLLTLAGASPGELGFLETAGYGIRRRRTRSAGGS